MSSTKLSKIHSLNDSPIILKPIKSFESKNSKNKSKKANKIRTKLLIIINE